MLISAEFWRQFTSRSGENFERLLNVGPPSAADITAEHFYSTSGFELLRNRQMSKNNYRSEKPCLMAFSRSVLNANSFAGLKLD